MLLALPVAPTSNNAFFNKPGQGRIKTAKYRRWLRVADAHYLVQGLQRVKPITVPYRTRMIFPDTIKGDLDGRAKLILDWLVSRKLTPDDRHQRSLQLDYGHRPDGLVLIEVTPHEASHEPAEPRV